MKKYIYRIFIILGFSLYYSFGLKCNNDLSIVNTPQITDVWCWASSIKMVNDFYGGKSMSQCDLVNLHRYNLHGNGTLSNTLSDFCNLQTSCPSDYSVIDEYLYTLEFNSLEDIEDSQNQSNFDFILSRLGYYSMEDYNLLSWEVFKNEIENCRPVILIYDADISNGNNKLWTSHAVVAKGYEEDLFNEEDFFLISDPWEKCFGDEYFLNKDVLGYIERQTDNNITVSGIHSMIHHIYPKEVQCDDVCSFVKEQNLIQVESARQKQQISPSNFTFLIRKFRNDFFATTYKEILTKEKINKYTSTSTHFSTSVIDLSYDNFRKQELTSLNFDSLIVNRKVKSEILRIEFTKSSPNLISSVHCNNDSGKCKIEKIGISRREPIPLLNIPNLPSQIQLNNTTKRVFLIQLFVFYHIPWNFIVLRKMNNFITTQQENEILKNWMALLK